VEPTAPSALVVSRFFCFDGRLVQNGGSAKSALRLTLTVVSACSPLPKTATAIQPTDTPIKADYFPLTVGTYWIYEGTVEWTVGTEVKEDTVRWKMEVVDIVDAVHNNGVVAYVMKGHPRNLAWYEKGKPRSDYLIIRSGETRYYYTSIEVLTRLVDEDDDLYDLVSEENLFLDMPLVTDEKFCAAEHITRYNGGYCWIVGEAKVLDTKDIKGLEGLGELSEYSVWQGTQSDDSALGFVPGVGISRYRYRHHGTVSTAEVWLVEYHSGGS